MCTHICVQVYTGVRGQTRQSLFQSLSTRDLGLDNLGRLAPGNPRDLPVCNSSALGIQTCICTTGFFSMGAGTLSYSLHSCTELTEISSSLLPTFFVLWIHNQEEKHGSQHYQPPFLILQFCCCTYTQHLIPTRRPIPKSLLQMLFWDG